MNKIIFTPFFVIIFVLSFLVQHQTSYAVSGACSYHSGVNCSAGPSSNGSVICNDGWIDSSASYYSQTQCIGVEAPRCIYPISYGCTSDADYESLKSSIGGINTMTGLPLNSSQQSQLSTCQNEISSYKKRTEAYDKCMYDYQHQETYIPTPEASSSEDELTNTKIKDYILELQEKNELLKIKNEMCQNILGLANYNPETSECDCAESTVLVNGSCTFHIENITENTNRLAQPVNNKPQTLVENKHKESSNNTVAPIIEKENVSFPATSTETISITDKNTPQEYISPIEIQNRPSFFERIIYFFKGLF